MDYWETEDVEKKYIFEALELLSTRENILMSDEQVSFYTNDYYYDYCSSNKCIFYFIFIKDVEMKGLDNEVMNSTLSSSLGSPPVIINKKEY